MANPGKRKPAARSRRRPAAVATLDIQFEGQARLAISRTCTIHLPPNETLLVRLSSGGHWFGHGFSHVQPCPLEAGSIANSSFAVNNIQSPIWMCTAGFALLADTRAVLQVRINADGDGLLRIRCPDRPLALQIFKGRNLPAARAALMKRLDWPNRPPPAAMFGDSLFCTWTQYPRCITQKRILDMASQIRAHDYPCSTLIIDDRWESCFGDLTFSRDFPDPRAMIKTLHRMKFRVWLWVTPFVNQEASTFADLSRRGFLVPAADGTGAALMKWWAGTAGVVDLTNPAARKWYRGRLLDLQKRFGVDGFKIDGGDFKYQPTPDIARWHANPGPSGYADALLSLFEEVVPNQCETRTAWLSQSRGIIWRQGGKDSHWGLDNGLPAMVNLAIHLGLMGYDILIPDMIPGRVQTLKSDMPLPTDELMIRWTEATAFMPIMQFSYFPWNYAPSTGAAVRAYAKLHKALQPYLAAQAARRTAPLLRPAWYDHPNDPDRVMASGQFMLGSDILVAPVTTEGAVSRDVRLPPGRWIDAWTVKPVKDAFLKDHPSPCPGIPIFIRAGNARLAKTVNDMLKRIPRGITATGITSTLHRAGLDRDITVTG